MGHGSRPFIRDLKNLGHVQGITISDKKDGADLCHYIGGLPYALPPTGPFRWQKPRPLPPDFQYGNRSRPGRFTRGTRTCPQLRFGDNAVLPGTDEDCLQLNIWLPTRPPPAGGFPVLFFIHGGFLQFGAPNGYDLSALLSETDFNAVVIMPHYRVNLFGFLSLCELSSKSDSSNSVANYGFYDQRLALEWTYKHITLLGGNPTNITLAGYSAGAYSAFHQLAHDLYQQSPSDRLVARCIMWSNGPGLPPRSHADAQRQFDELCEELRIPSELPPAKKLSRLRSLPASTLVAATAAMHTFCFRPIRDPFIPRTLFADLRSGAFAARMLSRSVPLMLGECANEHFLYAQYRPPRAPASLPRLLSRLRADYQDAAVAALGRHYFPDGALPPGWDDWRDAFGRVYAGVQVHALQRGLAAAMDRAGAADLLFRYRVEWRAECAPLPREWGATHTTDTAVWFWGNGWGGGRGLRRKEKEAVRRGLFDLFVKFVHGDVEAARRGWGTGKVEEVRCLKENGTVEIERDELWEEGNEVWDLLMGLALDEDGRQRRARM